MPNPQLSHNNIGTETPKRIQRRRTRGWRMPPNTVCVTRPGRFGNPFRVGFECQALSPAEAVAKFRKAIENLGGFYSAGDRNAGKPMVTIADIKRELRGKNLACFCALKDKDGKAMPCHADVLLQIANQ